MLRFRCNNCGCKIKVQDKHAGRKGKCPKCQQIVVIPNVAEQELTRNEITAGIRPLSGDRDAVGVPAQDNQIDKTSDQTKPCPYCGETILAVAKKCKHCQEFLDVPSRTQTAADKPDLDVSQLQEEYERLQRERKTYNRFGFCFGIPGFILNSLAIVFFVTGVHKEYAAAVFFVALAGAISMGIGFSYVAMYKGRNPWLGLLILIPFWIISIIILLLLKDYKKERMDEINSILKGMPFVKTSVKTSGLAIASLVLGICGFITAGLTSIAGLIIGIIGLGVIKNNAERLGGKGLAIAGITTSSVGLLFFMIIILVPALSTVRNQSRTLKSVANARQLCLGMQMYIDNNKDRFPPADSWPEKLRAYNCQEKVFTSPHNPNAGQAYAMNASLSGKQIQQIRQPDKTVLIFEARFGSPPGGGPELLPEKPRGRKGYVIGFADFHIERVPAEGLDQLIWEIPGGGSRLPSTRRALPRR